MKKLQPIDNLALEPMLRVFSTGQSAYGTCYLCHGMPLHPHPSWPRDPRAYKGYKVTPQDQVYLCASCRNWLGAQHIEMLERALGHRVGQYHIGEGV